MKSIEDILMTGRGSLYLQMCNDVRKNLKNGDWVWLHNKISDEKIMASQFENLSQKFAVIFKNLGVKYGDVVHFMVGNHNHTFVALGGLWIIGAIGSFGNSHKWSGGYTKSRIYDVELEKDPKVFEKQLREVNPKILICTKETAETAQEALDLAESGTSISGLNDFSVKLVSFGPNEGTEK